MANEEMQGKEVYCRNTDQTATKKVRVIRAAKDRSEKRWKQTEARLHALLAHARKQERKVSAPQRKPRPLRKTAADTRLRALAELVERQISERRNGKP